jgi:vanillin dehydrogenase
VRKAHARALPGWGRFGGRAALEEFTELRWVTIQEGHRHYPI